MLFPTHLVAAYLIGRRWELPTLPIVAGAALPDLIDKPLASVGVVDLYHTVGHSLVALAVLGAVVLLAERWFAPRGGARTAIGHRHWLALWVGWVSHLALDALQMVVNGRPDDVRFLLWPFVHHVPAVQLPPLAFASYYVGTPTFFLEIGIWVAFLAVLWRGRRRSASEGR